MATSNIKKSVKTGIYLLETLTAGMYNNPLVLYREYIQNSADSIDYTINKGKKVKQLIHIDLDPIKKSIFIKDFAGGIPVEKSSEILNSIGISYKSARHYRGFRGIGRLSGISFSDNVIFKTKSEGEGFETEQIWDCKKLRSFIANSDKYKQLTLNEVFDKCVTTSIKKSTKEKASYFSVSLIGVTSFRNYLFDIIKVEKYLSQSLPVQFKSSEFTHKKEIESFLKTNVDNYNTYQIKLNGEEIYKPYSNTIGTFKRSDADRIVGIEFFTVKQNEETLGYGWFGKRNKLIGSINRPVGTQGIRVFSGNMLIGDEHLLDDCFRENRFNSYYIGEIHVVNSNLIVNSRRDNFIDNPYKTMFFTEVEKIIGIPLSKEIRRKSRENTEGKNKLNYNNVKFTTNNNEVIIDKSKLLKLKENCTSCPHAIDFIKGI